MFKRKVEYGKPPDEHRSYIAWDLIVAYLKEHYPGYLERHIAGEHIVDTSAKNMAVPIASLYFAEC